MPKLCVALFGSCFYLRNVIAIAYLNETRYTTNLAALQFGVVGHCLLSVSRR